MLRVSVKDNGGINVGHDHGRVRINTKLWGRRSALIFMTIFSYSKVLSDSLNLEKTNFYKDYPRW